MSTSRRDFIKQAACLSGSLGVFSALPPSLARALSIDPKPGSTFMDAKHVVILMQENRSFDHMYGTFRGARGFDDPRAITLADGNPVFLQSMEGKTYRPFNLDIHGSKATWMGALPHGRADQLLGGNNGKHDRWIPAKKKDALPAFTLGYYEEKDIPFYHAFADSFTLCDQHHCAIASSTTPNRSYLWTGTIRYKDKPEEAPCVTNSMLDRRNLQSWTTFPERLSKAGVSWRVYQNEISEPTGLEGSARNWLGNFTNNPLEWFSQYRVGSHSARREFLLQQEKRLKEEIATLQNKKDGKGKNQEKELYKKQEGLKRLQEDLASNPALEDASIPAATRDLHDRAFTSNQGDPDYHNLSAIEYERDGQTEKVEVPASDPFYQFRKDVDEGRLPTVSWLIASREFSDHPASAWYGAWYVAEALNILTKNPEIWKDTIFILNYDENDGYFDHVPPYNPPRPEDLSTGLCSEDIDTRMEFELNKEPLGLGYRVPLIVASPWSRGGRICSELFDTTSVIRFLEVFLSDKVEKPIYDDNITSWRRNIVGDLTNIFQSGQDLAGPFPKPPVRDEFVAAIHRAQFEGAPTNPPLSDAEIAEVRKDARKSRLIPAQQSGSRISRALPYELYAEAHFDAKSGRVAMTMAVGQERFGERSLGAPFQVYAPEGFAGSGKAGSDKKSAADSNEEAKSSEAKADAEYEKMRRWSFALSPGKHIDYHWPLASFPDQRYALDLYGPNGFFRGFRGSSDDAELRVNLRYGEGEELLLSLVNLSKDEDVSVVVSDLSYGGASTNHKIAAGEDVVVRRSVAESGRWYDVQITVEGKPHFSRRCAGRMENGEDSTTDPLIGSRMA